MNHAPLKELSLWILHCQDMLSFHGARGEKAADLSGAHSEPPCARGRNDGTRWQRANKKQAASGVSSSGASHHLKNWKVMLWVLVSLLALVDSVMPGERSDPSIAVGHMTGQWPTRISKVNEMRDGGGFHSPWGDLFANPFLLDEEEDQQSRWERSPSDPAPFKSSRKNRNRSRSRNRKHKSGRDCRVERKEMKVRDLGLGFDSDEIVLFKYCAGTCHSVRKNYDLALKALLENGSLPKHSSKRVSTHPCCRPTRYETVSFMDAQTTWRTIKWLSAANCSCVG